MITRMQLGTSRLEALKPRALEVFLNDTWVHLGDPEYELGRKRAVSPAFLKEMLRRYSVSYVVKRGFQELVGFKKKTHVKGLNAEEVSARTNFKTFWYEKGNELPFENESLCYIFSEHFFEHLFLDEALSLLKECHRILKPNGVIRTSVPDADLRTYEPPEPLGFPDSKLAFSDPAKHKTRWSVYSLAEVIKLAGFEPVPLRYCDKTGQYVCREPSEVKQAYEACPDREIVLDMSYIMRKDSLIIDGVKRNRHESRSAVGAGMAESGRNSGEPSRSHAGRI